MDKSVEYVIADGKTAQRLLADEVFQAACDAVEQRAVETWKTSKPEDIKLRETEYYTVQALRRVRRELAVIEEAGAMAEHEVKIEQARRAPARAARQ